jgi:hypothetical protein
MLKRNKNAKVIHPSLLILYLTGCHNPEISLDDYRMVDKYHRFGSEECRVVIHNALLDHQITYHEYMRIRREYDQTYINRIKRDLKE